MADIEAKAEQAARLLRDETFQDVLSTIRDDAVALFLRATSSITEIEAAHSKIAAVQLILDEVERRIDAGKIEAKARKRAAP